MRELIDALGTLRDPGAEPPADAGTVAGDVARGRRALAVRRYRRIAAAGCVAAAAVVAVTVGQSGPSGQAGPSVASGPAVHHAAPGAAAPRTSAAPRQTPRIQLAAYTGAQPAGFRVTTVPAGWKVISSDPYAFVAVPPGSTTTAPPAGGLNMQNAISVMLQGQSHFAPGTHVTTVDVNGRHGQLGLTSDKGAKWLIFPDAKGHMVLIQVYTDLGLTDQQIVRIAQGVSVTGAVRASVG